MRIFTKQWTLLLVPVFLVGSMIRPGPVGGSRSVAGGLGESIPEPNLIDDRLTVSEQYELRGRRHTSR